MSSEISGSAPKNPTLKLKSVSRVSPPKIQNDIPSTKPKTASSEVTTKSLEDHAGKLNVLLDEIHNSTSTLENTQERLNELGTLLDQALKLTQSGQTDNGASFKNILEQIDTLAKTQQTGDINLLQGDSISTPLDAGNNNVVKSSGADFSAQGLGLANTQLDTPEKTAQAIPDIKAAQQLLYTFKTKISNDVTTIKDQAYFTQGAIFTATNNTTTAQTNKGDEAANLLALQTRQILRNTANVPLASQSQQNLLRLF